MGEGPQTARGLELWSESALRNPRTEGKKKGLTSETETQLRTGHVFDEKIDSVRMSQGYKETQVNKRFTSRQNTRG